VRLPNFAVGEFFIIPRFLAMRSLNFFLSLILFTYFCTLSAIASAEESTSANHDTSHAAHDNLDWPGMYFGFLPCDDCKGVKTTLGLNKNHSYILITQYIGKSEREFVEKGKFTWGTQERTIVLTPRKSSATKYFLVGEDMLTQLDENGERFSGEQAHRYILRRTDVTGLSQQHSSH
jgi:uncharacterized lipoprotein NlpE involved in copper resistance